MKKSEIYKYAQCAVVDSENICTLTKLEILRVLMSDEDSALYWEKEEEKKKAAEEAKVEHETV